MVKKYEEETKTFQQSQNLKEEIRRALEKLPIIEITVE